MVSLNKPLSQNVPTYKGKRAGIYMRVSTDKQEEGNSFEFQREKALEWIQEQGCSIDPKHIWKDSHTGTEFRERPGLTAMREAAKRGEFDILVMYKLDRLARKRLHQEIVREELQYYGVTTVTLKADEHADDDSPTGEIIRTIYGIIAEEERNNILQRTYDGTITKAKNGYLVGTGKPLYGYIYNGREKERTHYLIHPEESKVVRRIFDMAVSGKTIRQIAIALSEEGIPTPSGKNTIWRVSTVSTILANPFYIGKATYFKKHVVKEAGKTHLIRRNESEQIELAEGVVPAIVDRETFEKVQQQLAANREKAARNNMNPQDALLRCGLVICGYCGDKMVIRRDRRNNHNKVLYICIRKSTRRGDCKGCSILASTIDNAAWQRAVEIIRNPVLVTSIIEQRRKADPTSDARKAIKKKLAKLEREIENCTRTIREAKNHKIRAMFAEDLERLMKDQEDLEKMLKNMLSEQEEWRKTQEVLDKFTAWCNEMRDRLDDPQHEISYEEKRTACEIIGLKGLVWQHDHKPYHFVIECAPPLLCSTDQPISDMHQ